MFLHLGSDTVIPKKEIILIIDLKKASDSEVNREFLQLTKREGFQEIGEGEQKSLIITTDKVYLSPISSTTLKKRADSIEEMIQNW